MLRLEQFHRAHSAVKLDILVDHAVVDIVGGRFDTGIRVGERIEKDMTSIRLTPDVRMLAVAAPEYLARAGTQRSPSHLQRHACINWQLQPNWRAYRWEFARKSERKEIEVEGPLLIDVSARVILLLNNKRFELGAPIMLASVDLFALDDVSPKRH